MGFQHRIPHENNCGKYYECQPNGERVEYACIYPMQFDEFYYECRPYDSVDCGTRAEAKDLCIKIFFEIIQIYKYHRCIFHKNKIKYFENNLRIIKVILKFNFGSCQFLPLIVILGHIQSGKNLNF